MLQRPSVTAVAVLSFVAAATPPGRTGKSQPATAHIRNSDDNGLPIARPGRALPANSAQRALRLKRNRAFNSSAAPVTATTGDILVFSETQPERLPVAKSDLIIVGRVVSGEAFLSENESAVYSEFHVRTEDVLRATARSGIARETTITAIRWGGMLELPSGRVVRVEQANERLPHLGGRYLMFLDYERPFDGYRIITAYSLEGNQAQTLDGARGVFPDTGRAARPGPESADALLAEVRRLVISSNGRAK